MLHDGIMMSMFGSSSNNDYNVIRLFLGLLLLLTISLPFTASFSINKLKRSSSFQYPDASTATERSNGRFLFSIRRYVQPKTSSATIIPPNKKNNNKYKKENALETCLRESFSLQEIRQQIYDGNGMATTTPQVVLFLDFNNIRGKSDFACSHAEFLWKLSKWMKVYHDDDDLVVICAVDHASKEETIPISNNLLVVFAGPDQTADDVIAKGTRWFVELDEDDDDEKEEETEPKPTSTRNMIFVVTSDGELRQRCLRSNPNHRHTKKHHHKRSKKRKKSLQRDCVKVFSSFQFLDCLESIDNFDERINPLTQITSQNTEKQQDAIFQQRLSAIENDIRLYESKRPPWSSRQEKLDAMESGPWKSTLLLSQSAIVENSKISEEDDVRQTQTKIATNNYDMASGTDASYAASPFRELTWHRILIAESMRRLRLAQFELQAESNVSLLSGHKLLEGYQLYYRGLYDDENESSRKWKKNDVDDQSILWDDHRIRHDLDAQHYLRLYLEESFRTVNLQRHPDGASCDDVIDEAVTLGNEDPRRPIHSAVDFEKDIGSVYQPKTPLEESVETLTRLVEESPTKTQDQILMRYMKEAPSFLQFSRRYDLQQLLLLLAIRERRNGDSKPQWYLRKQEDNRHPSSSPDNHDACVKNLDFYIQPGQGKRRKGRQRAAKRKQARDMSPNQLVDEKTLIGRKSMERLQADWVDLVI